MRLEELKVYQLAMEVGEETWRIAKSWKYFEKETLGKQFVRSADSISANISEGYGRFHYKDSKLFYYYARGSLYETKTWLIKAYKRKLLLKNEYLTLYDKLEHVCALLNNYIKSVGP